MLHELCVYMKERKRREGASGKFKCDGRHTSFEPFLYFFMSTQPSMNTLGEQLATMACVLVVDVIIQ